MGNIVKSISLIRQSAHRKTAENTSHSS